MNEYIIYCINGQYIKVFADDFDADYNKKRVRFFHKASSGYETIAAVFLFDNIFGFMKTNKENENDTC